MPDAEIEDVERLIAGLRKGFGEGTPVAAPLGTIEFHADVCCAKCRELDRHVTLAEMRHYWFVDRPVLKVDIVTRSNNNVAVKPSLSSPGGFARPRPKQGMTSRAVKTPMAIPKDDEVVPIWCRSCRRGRPLDVARAFRKAVDEVRAGAPADAIRVYI